MRVRPIIALALFVACSPAPPPSMQQGDDAPSSGGDAQVSDGVDAMSDSDACAMLAAARCTKLMGCSAADLTKQFGPMTACVARESLACTDELAAADTGATPSTMVACGDALTAETCADFLGIGSPAACIVAGPGTATCTFEAQCATSFCAIGANSMCGLCQADPVAGASCAASSCGPTLVCDGNNSLCAKPAEAGQACNKTIPCDHALACVGDTNQNNGQCQLQITTLGAACDQTRKTRATCNSDDGLACDTNTNKCVAMPLVDAGQPCGPISGIENACSAGASCVIPMGQTTGKCVAPAADGAACDTKAGPDCFFPARCIPTASPATAGTCQLPGTQSC